MLCLPQVGIGIQKLIQASSFTASGIPVQYRAKKCWTVSFYLGTGQVPALLLIFSPVPDWQDAGQSGTGIYCSIEKNNFTLDFVFF
jgi:hypothetical protein